MPLPARSPVRGDNEGGAEALAQQIVGSISDNLIPPLPVQQQTVQTTRPFKSQINRFRKTMTHSPNRPRTVNGIRFDMSER